MTKTLRERMAAVRELDKARTPGEIIAKEFAKAPASGKAKAIDRWKLSTQTPALGSMEKADALFLAQAPEMASIITDLERKLEVAEEGLKEIKNEIFYFMTRNVDEKGSKSYATLGQIKEDAIQTLTLISLDNQPGE